MAKRKTKSVHPAKNERKAVKAFKPTRKSSRASADTVDEEQLYQTLKRYIRIKARGYLRDPNITSIGIAHKNGNGPVCLRFTVERKGDQTIRIRNSYRIPKTIEIDGIKVQTDVVERSYTLDFNEVASGTVDQRQRRIDPIQPGFSVSHIDIDAGTIGLIVFDRHGGAPCILSNWHILQGLNGKEHDDIIQPGRRDFDPSPNIKCAELVRGFAYEVGDAALAKLLTSATDPQARSFSREIFGLGVTPSGLAEVRMQDRVIKSGRTTGVTRGIVTAVEIQARLEVGDRRGPRRITCFEISPDPDAPPPPMGVAAGGDSGSAWMIFQDGAATGLFAGLHFSGDVNLNGENTAFACYARSIQTKLEFDLLPPV